MRKLLTVLAVWFLFIPVVRSEKWETYSYAYNYKDGLQGMYLYDLHIAASGALYIASDKGIILFNGVTFTTLPSVRSLPRSVSSIREASDGILYCKSFGSELYKVDRDSLVLLKTPKSEDRIQEIVLYRDTLFLIYPKEVWRLHPASGYQRKLYESPANDTSELFDLIQHQDTIWIASSDKMIGLPKSGAIVYKAARIGEKYFSKHGNAVYYTNRNFEKGIYTLDGHRAFDIPLGVSPIYLRSTGVYLWLCSHDGLFALPDKNSTLKEMKVSDVVMDPNGTLWVSTVGSGLYVLPDNDLTYISSLQKANGEVFKRLETNASDLWAGTSWGRVWQVAPSGSVKSILGKRSETEISALYVQDSATLWSTNGGWNLRSLNQIHSSFLGNYINSDPYGRLVISFHAGTGISTITTKGVAKYPLPKHARILPNAPGFIPAIMGNRRARCAAYVAPLGGYLIGFNDKAELFTWSDHTIFDTPNGAPLVLNDIVQAGDTIWFATANEGIWRLYNNSWTHFDTENGLLHSNVRKLRLAPDGVWLLTENGVQFINSLEGKVVGVGFPFGRGITYIHDFILLNGFVYMTTSDGLLRYPLEKYFMTGTSNRPCKIAVYESNNLMQQGVSLPFSKRKITVQFDAFILNSFGLYDYSYRLLGFDTSWVTASSSNNVVRYPALPPGDYRFQVKSKQGTKESPISSYHFSILTPWWASWWFYVLAAAVCISFMALLYMAVAVQNAKRLKQKEQLLKSQLTALRAQMNPHFLYNVLNAVQGMIYTNKKVEAGDYLGKFSDLMRKTLENSDKQRILLKQELEMLHLYLELEAVRFDGELAYEVFIDPAIDASTFELPTMLLQPFIENAIKHGLLHKKGEKKLLIRVVPAPSRTDHAICVEITDNGIGRVASRQLHAVREKKSTTFAVNAIQNRIELLNKQLKQTIRLDIQDLYHDTSVPAGTYVCLTIPPLAGL